MTMPTERPERGRTWQEELTATGDEVVARVKELIEAGNVRRVIVKHDGRTLLELPLTLGVVGTLLAPQVAALGAMAALLTRCTLTVEREESGPPRPGEPPSEMPEPRQPGGFGATEA